MQVLHQCRVHKHPLRTEIDPESVQPHSMVYPAGSVTLTVERCPICDQVTKRLIDQLERRRVSTYAELQATRVLLTEAVETLTKGYSITGGDDLAAKLYARLHTIDTFLNLPLQKENPDERVPV